MDSNTDTPPPSFYFSISLDNETVSFQEIAGVNLQESRPVETDDTNRFIHKVLERPKYDNLVLKRGFVTANSKFLARCKSALENFVFTPTDIQVSLLNSNSVCLKQWTFYNAYPVALKVSGLHLQGGNVAFDTVELAYDYFEVNS